MIRNYVRIALRNLLKHKAYSAINITGLAVGMACSLLILLYVREEIGFDRFHEHAGSIYRGRGVSTDSVEASAKAFLNAINRIVAIENGKK